MLGKYGILQGKYGFYIPIQLPFWNAIFFAKSKKRIEDERHLGVVPVEKKVVLFPEYALSYNRIFTFFCEKAHIAFAGGDDLGNRYDVHDQAINVCDRIDLFGNCIFGWCDI